MRVVDGSGAPAGCEKRGEVEVSVKDSVAFYDRNPLRVREELETLARNEAPGLQADTVQPMGEPARWRAALRRLALRRRRERPLPAAPEASRANAADLIRRSGR